MSKKTDKMELLFQTKYEECYGLGKDIYLFKNTDRNITEFKIYNLGYIKNCNEPIIEIKVIPKDALINIFSFYIENKTKLITAKYDDIEKDWDVRLYINNKEKLTNFNNSINNLETLDFFGNEIKEKVISIIDTSKNIFANSFDKNKITI